MTASTFQVALTPPQAVESVDLVVQRPDVEAEAEGGGAAVLVAHGAGTTRDHPSLLGLRDALVSAGHTVGLANFPFTEAGRRRPDPMPRLERAWTEVVQAFVEVTGATATPGVGEGPPLVLAGRSMGGRVASLLLADGRVSAAGWVAVAYPLHPAKAPEKLRTAHWPDLDTPALLVSGDRDALAPLDTLRAEVGAHLDPARTTLHVLSGADHSLAVRKRDGRTPDEVIDELHRVVCGWLAALVS